MSALTARSRVARSTPCLALLALCLACTHARTAADAQQEERQAQQAEAEGGSAANEEKKGDAKGASDGEAKNDEDPPREGRASAASDKKEKRDDGAASDKGEDGQVDPEDIEVATSPQGLLEPGALDKVRDKLGVPKGQGVQSALRRFQREHDLPATGMLDHETVERLGLSPDEIFEE